AGIVEGANKGEGLGNQFLSHIRQVDAICQVVRCFEDENITHVSGDINPLDDIETVNLELMLADLETVNRRYEKAEKMARQKEKTAEVAYKVMNKKKKVKESKTPVRNMEKNKDEQKIVQGLHILKAKPLLYVTNVGEDEVTNVKDNEK